MKAGVGARNGHITAHRVTVAMLGAVGALNAVPALGVALLQHQRTAIKPAQHFILSVVGHGQPLAHCRIGLARFNAQGGANAGKRKLAVDVQLNQSGGEIALAGLEVHRAGQAKVAHGVDRTAVRVTGLGNGLDRSGKLAGTRLVVKAKGVAPLVIVAAGFDDPARGQRRYFALGADIIQHQKGDTLAVGGTGRYLALDKARDDEAASIGVPSAVALVSLGQEGRPGAFDRTVFVQLQIAVAVFARLLAYKQHRLALGGDVGQIGCKLHLLSRKLRRVHFGFLCCDHSAPP